MHVRASARVHVCIFYFYSTIASFKADLASMKKICP